MLCQYKDVLGEIGKGIHSYRLLGLAIMDVFFTIVGSYIIHRIIPQYRFIYILLFIFLLGILLHRMFCVRTTIDRLLFG